MTTRNNDRLYEITILNVIAILLVVLGHSGCIYAGKWSYVVVNNSSEILKYITNFIYSFHMPLFVFVSGYLFSYGKSKDKYKSLKEFCVKKFKRLIIPYIIVGSFFMIPIQMIFEIDNISTPYMSRIFSEIFLGKTPRHLWFLLMLFNLFIIFYLLENIFKKNKVYINFIVLFLLSVIAVKIPNFYQVSGSIQYMLFFYLGYVAYNHNKLKTIYINKSMWIIIISYILLFNINYFIIGKYISLSSNTIVVKVLDYSIDKIISILGVMSIYLFINNLKNKNYERLERVCKSKLIFKINNLSFLIYLIHQPIMLIVLKKISLLDISPFTVYTTLFWVTLIVSIILSDLYLLLIGKVKNRYISNIKVSQTS
ncbi:MAG: acyltransferase [Clostridium sp.]|nr:acyltransferase [Clostridium sp.]